MNAVSWQAPQVCIVETGCAAVQDILTVVIQQGKGGMDAARPATQVLGLGLAQTVIAGPGEHRQAPARPGAGAPARIAAKIGRADGCES